MNVCFFDHPDKPQLCIPFQKNREEIPTHPDNYIGGGTPFNQETTIFSFSNKNGQRATDRRTPTAFSKSGARLKKKSFESHPITKNISTFFTFFKI